MIFTIPRAMGIRLDIISQKGIDAASTCWHRQHVAFVDVKSQAWMYGQVDGLAFPTMPMVIVKTLSGMFEVELADEAAPILSVYPVVATLLATCHFQFEVAGSSKKHQKSIGIPSKYTVKQLERMHDLVFNRVRGIPDEEEVDVKPNAVIQPNIGDVLRGIMATKDMPTPFEVRSFINPYSGDRCVAWIIHVLLYTHYHGCQLPVNLVEEIGGVFCVDPVVTQPLFSQPELQPLGQTTHVRSPIQAEDICHLTNAPIIHPEEMVQSVSSPTLTRLGVSPRSRVVSPRIAAAPQATDLQPSSDMHNPMVFQNTVRELVNTPVSENRNFHMRLSNEPTDDMSNFHATYGLPEPMPHQFRPSRSAAYPPVPLCSANWSG